MSRRLVIAGVASAAVLGAVIPSFASAVGNPVTVDTSNGVAVGVHDGPTPIAGAQVTPNGVACFGIGLQRPFCTPDVIGGIAATIPQQEGPVTIDTSNGVGVGVQLGSQPIVGAHVSPGGQVCVGVSLEVPFCTPVVSTSSQKSSQATQKLPPVVVRHDENGTAVGVDDVGVVIYPDGTICPVVSTQAWRCIPGN